MTHLYSSIATDRVVGLNLLLNVEIFVFLEDFVGHDMGVSWPSLKCQSHESCYHNSINKPKWKK